MKTSLIVAVTVLLLPVTCRAAGSSDGIAFEQHGAYTQGPVVIQQPQGGEYVYSSALPADDRRPMRFMMGKPQREDYELFSGKEEAALVGMRDAELARIADAARARIRPRRISHPKPKLNWPKVVVIDDRTCVPELGYATAADWKDHLVCWNAGTNRVE
jgi:hypothetical protein